MKRQRAWVSKLKAEPCYARAHENVEHPSALHVVRKRVRQRNGSIARALAELEPRCCSGQPDIAWRSARGAVLEDEEGRRYIDCTSGVMVANAGHAPRQLVDAIGDMLECGLLHAYGYPTTIKLDFLRELRELLQKPDYKILLKTTGSETIESAVKLVREFYASRGAPERHVIVGYRGGFHGRTMGAQLVTGTVGNWIVGEAMGFVQVNFPDEGSSSASFGDTLAELRCAGVSIQQTAAFIIEPYQGSTGRFLPDEYARALSRYCKEQDIVLVVDEVQSGFGRTGTLLAHQHYDMIPDLIALGKGLSGGLPVSALVGRPEIMDSVGPKTMGSTHAANPVCLAAALANVRLHRDGRLTEAAKPQTQSLQEGIRRIAGNYPSTCAAVVGRGMVAALSVEHRGKPSAEKATGIVRALCRRGVFVFSPLGPTQSTIKLTPPLTITMPQVVEVLRVLDRAIDQVDKEWRG